MNGIAPGWYFDGSNEDVERYWDGSQWTNQLRKKATPDTPNTEDAAYLYNPNTVDYSRMHPETEEDSYADKTVEYAEKTTYGGDVVLPTELKSNDIQVVINQIIRRVIIGMGIVALSLVAFTLDAYPDLPKGYGRATAVVIDTGINRGMVSNTESFSVELIGCQPRAMYTVDGNSYEALSKEVFATCNYTVDGPATVAYKVSSPSEGYVEAQHEITPITGLKYLGVGVGGFMLISSVLNYMFIIRKDRSNKPIPKMANKKL